MLGIDVSNNNGSVDWKAVAKARFGVTRQRVRFAWVKATEGDFFTDSYLDENLAGARAHGIAVGAYHFARPDRGDAVAEAEHFLAAYKPLVGDLLPILDFEHDAHLSGVSMTAWAKRWIEHVEKQTGVEVAFYSYPYFLSGDMGGGDALHGRKLWYADYSGVGGRLSYPKQAAPFRVVAQQYTSNGSVPGVHGRVDMNYAKSLGPIRIPKPTPVEKPDTFWTWARWYLGRSEFTGHQRDPKVRPNVPKKIPASWWGRLKKHTKGA